MKIQTPEPGTTINYAPHGMTPRQGRLLEAINLYESWREQQVSSFKLDSLREKMEDLYQDFRQDTGHGNEPWILPTMRGMMAAATGNLREAIQLDTEALQAARLPVEKAKSHNNLGDSLRRLSILETDPAMKRELIEQAVSHGVIAVAKTRSCNVGMMITLAQALIERDGPGDQPDAEDLLKVALQMENDAGVSPTAVAHFQFDSDLRESAAPGVKATQKLLQEIRA